MGKILILGAGIYQVPLINAARNRGLEVLVTSVRGDYPGFALADKVYHVNTTDEKAILSIAETEKVDGICTAGTDVALKSLGYVVDRMGLSGISYQAAKASSNKLVMKKLFEQNQIKTARFSVASSIEDCYKAFEELNKPVIFKVLDSSGSRGVIRVDQKEEIPSVFTEVKAVSAADDFIIEEFIEGLEFGMQAFIESGKLLFALPHGDMLHRDKKTVPVGHYVPFDKKIDGLEKDLLQAVNALGMDNCAINADLIEKDGQVYFLEIAGRAGATCLPELVSIYYNIDYYDLIVAAAIGESITADFSHHHAAAAEIITSPASGTYNGIEYNFLDTDVVENFTMDYKPGEKVRKFEVGPDRIGQVIVKGKDLNTALTNLENFKKQIRLSIAQD